MCSMPDLRSHKLAIITCAILSCGWASLDSASQARPAAVHSPRGAAAYVRGTSGTRTDEVQNVAPRSPTPGDLRFQGVDSQFAARGYGGPNASYLEYPFERTFQNGVGSPLRIGSGICVAGVPLDCAWFYSVTPMPSGSDLAVGYLPGVLENLDASLNSRSNGSSVVNSLDIEAGNHVFAIGWIQGSAKGFDCKHEIAPMSGVSALVASDGAKSRVVTAISIDRGQVHFLSYGWSSDRTTIYDTSVSTASYDNIPAQAIALAKGGYIITAFGGNPTDGYILVGTKVHGDWIPRPILTFPPTDATVSVTGYALVGQAIDLAEGNDSVTWIFER